MNNQAFSLVELSIVLVILGLLTGGILTGQNLIRAAELRSVTTDFSTYYTAVMSFRDKYFYLPGDMPNATDFWGSRDAGDGVGTDCTDNASTDSKTCNGDGDGIIDGTPGPENHRYWQHLANAGLIEGSYTGIGINPGHGVSRAGVNTPALKLSNAIFQVRYRSEIGTGSADFYAIPNGHVYFFGQSSGNGHDAIIATEEAWNLDTKIDDGLPALGNIRTYKKDASSAWLSSTKDCANNTDAGLARYDVSITGIKCALMFRLRF